MISPKTVYREGAEKGVYMGIYLMAMFFAIILSEWLSIASIVATILIVGLPLFAYKLIVRVHKKYFCSADFPSLWMLGIMIFIGGSMICALASYAYLQYADPEFIARQAEYALDTYKSLPESQNSEMVSMMQQAVKNGILPTPIEFSVEMLWMTSFCGSLLSAVLSAVARKRHPQQIAH